VFKQEQLYILLVLLLLPSTDQIQQENYMIG